MSKLTLLLERIGALSGLAFAGLLIAGFSIAGVSDPPSPDDPAAVIAAHLADNATGQDLAISLLLAAVACLVVFVSYLRHALQRAEPARTYLPATAWAGGLLLAAMLLVMIAIEVASGVVASYGDDSQVAKTLFILSWDFIYVVGPPLALLIGATSAAGLLHGGLPRWLSWAGVPLVALLLTPLTYFGFLLSLPWFVAVSLTLAVKTIRLPATGLVSRPV